MLATNSGGRSTMKKGRPPGKEEGGRFESAVGQKNQVRREGKEDHATPLKRRKGLEMYKKGAQGRGGQSLVQRRKRPGWEKSLLRVYAEETAIGRGLAVDIGGKGRRPRTGRKNE